jgi:hypothetical protein
MPHNGKNSRWRSNDPAGGTFQLPMKNLAGDIRKLKGSEYNSGCFYLSESFLRSCSKKIRPNYFLSTCEAAPATQF